jgi:hypothetical protein
MLIVAALVMVVEVIDFSLLGILPVVIGMVVVIRNWRMHRGHE